MGDGVDGGRQDGFRSVEKNRFIYLKYWSDIVGRGPQAVPPVVH